MLLLPLVLLLVLFLVLLLVLLLVLFTDMGSTTVFKFSLHKSNVLDVVISTTSSDTILEQLLSRIAALSCIAARAVEKNLWDMYCIASVC